MAVQGPINYLGLSPQVDLGQSIAEGLQIGAAFRQLRNQRQEEQRRRQLQERYQRGVERAYLAGGRPVDFKNLMEEFAGTEFESGLREQFNRLSKEQQDSDYKTGVEVYNALLNNNKEAAMRVIDQRIEASENSGLDVTDLRSIRGTLEYDPNGARNALGHILFTINPELSAKIFESDIKAAQEERAQQEILFKQEENIRKASEQEGKKEVKSSKTYANGVTSITYDDGTTSVIYSNGETVPPEERESVLNSANRFETELNKSNASAEEAVKIAQKEAANSYEKIGAIRSTLTNYDDALAALERGATTGAFRKNWLPTFKDSTIELNNIVNRLGLDIVSVGKFGALSENELDIALTTALPTSLSPENLEQWIIDKKAAQEKVLRYLEEEVKALSNGATLGELVERRQRESAQPRPSGQQDARNLTYRLSEGPNGRVVTFPNKEAYDRFIAGLGEK